MLENTMGIIQERKPRKKIHQLFPPAFSKRFPKLRPVQNSPCVSYKSLEFFWVWKWEFSFEVYVPLECLDCAGGSPALFWQKQTQPGPTLCWASVWEVRGKWVCGWSSAFSAAAALNTALHWAGSRCVLKAGGSALDKDWATAGRVTVSLGVHSTELHLSVK